MRRFLTGSLWPVLIAGFLFVGCDQSAIAPAEPDEAPAARNGDIIPGQYIVVLKPAEDFAGKTRRQVLDEMTTAVGVESQFRYESALTGFAAALSGEALARLESDDRVDYIEPDRVVTIPEFGMLGGGNGPGIDKGKPGGGGGGTPPEQVTPWGISRVNGVNGYTGSSVAWVIDTGIDADHPDLNVDAASGFSAFSKGRDAGTDDGHGHGSHVSGTIAAKNNTEGVIGVAPGATVIPVKVLDSRGSGSNSGVIAGVDFVGANGSIGDVANMSLGGGVSTALDNAVIGAAAGGVKFVLAAGNESDNANNHSPARANGLNVYTISAFGTGDNFASFSNYGNPPIDYAAPGVGIYSTYKGGGYATMSGTSMAAPHAAGVLLLGSFRTDGEVIGDRDNDPDTIIIH